MQQRCAVCEPRLSTSMKSWGFFPLSLVFGCRSKFQGTKWHVVALGESGFS